MTYQLSHRIGVGWCIRKKKKRIDNKYLVCDTEVLQNKTVIRKHAVDKWKCDVK